MAALLNGREYGDECDAKDALNAKANGLVIVYGYSDDNCEFRGAIEDEVGCYNGRTILFNDNGPVPEAPNPEEWEVLRKFNARPESGDAASLEAVWGEVRNSGPSWTYKAAFPHSTFDVMEDGEVFCRGIVFNLKEALNHKNT